MGLNDRIREFSKMPEHEVIKRMINIEHHANKWWCSDLTNLNQNLNELDTKFKILEGYNCPYVY